MMRPVLAIAALMLAAQPGFAQSARSQPASADRWAPWVGCWDLVDEEARDGAANALPAGDDRAPQPAPAATPRMCVARTGAAEATLTTSMGGQTVHALRVTPDGLDHPLTEAECRGTQRAEWSASAPRLYSSATLTCAGDVSTRRVSGMSLLTSENTWLDVQSVVVGARESVRVRRYRRSRDDANIAARRGGGPLTLDDIKEAASRVSPATLEAGLVEGSSGFPLDSKDLIGLREAGVPPSVIDVLVAISYPDRFEIDRGAPEVAYGMPGGALYDPFFMGWAFGDPFLMDHLGYYSRVYGVYSPYYYGPFNYRTFGSTVFVTNGIPVGGGGGGALPSEPTGTGRVVNGRGYTQVRPRETVPSGDAPPTSRTNRASSGGSNASTTQSSSGSSSSGGSVSPQGASSGGSGGGDGGRTAQPR
jgi:hypothetical protein